nr:DUF1501 domain-containing protein [Verrucomicrobium spinosum]
MISPSLSYVDALNRRTFLGGSARTLGFAALGSLITPDAFAAGGTATGLSGWPHLPVKARRVIYLFQSGAPSQMDLFDHKPSMAAYFGKDLPDSVRKGQRLTGMTRDRSLCQWHPASSNLQSMGKAGPPSAN